MRLNDFVHMRIKARRNTLHEQPLAKLVEFGERLTTQITRSPDDQMFKLQAAESIAQRSFEYTQQLANSGLSTPDPIAYVNCCGEAVDQGAVQVEERTNAWSG
jgi:RIO-like serine/threonine protein kinase